MRKFALKPSNLYSLLHPGSVTRRVLLQWLLCIQQDIARMRGNHAEYQAFGPGRHYSDALDQFLRHFEAPTIAIPEDMEFAVLYILAYLVYSSSSSNSLDALCPRDRCFMEKEVIAEHGQWLMGRDFHGQLFGPGHSMNLHHSTCVAFALRQQDQYTVDWHHLPCS